MSRTCSGTTGGEVFFSERRTTERRHERGSLDHLRDGDFGVVLEGVHHQPIAADVVDALWDGVSRGGVSELLERAGLLPAVLSADCNWG